MENDEINIRLWYEWRSWALPLRIGALGDYALFEIQFGPFGLTIYR